MSPFKKLPGGLKSVSVFGKGSDFSVLKEFDPVIPLGGIICDHDSDSVSKL